MMEMNRLKFILLLLTGVFQFFVAPLSAFKIEIKPSLGSKPPSQCLELGVPSTGYGLFSIFNAVVGVLHEYENLDYEGLVVNLGRTCTYYNRRTGSNCWEYYCEPIKLGKTRGIQKATLTEPEFQTYAMKTTTLSREAVFQIIEEHIKVKKQIKKKVEKFVEETFSNQHIIAIHYRGTDKIREAPRVSYAEMIDNVNNYIITHSLENYKIFIATDEQLFVDTMKAIFHNSVVVYESKRSLDGTPLHYGRSDLDPYKQGEDALIDCLLLARSDVLIRTSSNLSLWSTFFNPYIPVIEVSQAY